MLVMFSEQDSDEIIALYIDGNIYFAQRAIDEAKKKGTVDGIIKRSVFKFMAEFDLDPRWEEYSKYPTLFTVTEFNKFCENHP